LKQLIKNLTELALNITINFRPLGADFIKKQIRENTMINKEYLDRLKQEDYMAWDDLVNDPMVVGQNTGVGFVFPVVVLIVVFAIVVGICI
jgi:2-phosphoglycerate kinase